MTLPDELLREVRNDAFRTPVVLRRHAFVKRCDLSYFHNTILYCEMVGYVEGLQAAPV